MLSSVTYLICPSRHLESGSLLLFLRHHTLGVTPILESFGALSQDILDGAHKADVILKELNKVDVVGF